MSIENLNSQEFAKNLAQQAIQCVPPEFNEEQKNYIAQKVYEFSAITGDHLLKQYKEQFNYDQAVIIIQYIGEWTFHKAIDLINGGIDNQHWDQILQQVAFAALKAALHSYIEKFEEEKITAFIEYSVKTAYEESINQLIESNVIDQEKAKEALSQSNVDKVSEEIRKNQQTSPEEEEKTLKYAAIAMVLKKMPEQKVKKILEKMGGSEKEKLQSFLQIENLEQKLDAQLVNKYLRDLKKNIFSNTKADSKELIKSFTNLQSKYGEEEIINLTMFERSKIQKFLSACLFEDGSNALKVELSPYISKILYNYLKTNLIARNDH